MILRARQFEFIFPRPALVMGIVNVTPDSFFDGGRFLDVQAATAHSLELVEHCLLYTSRLVSRTRNAARWS